MKFINLEPCYFNLINEEQNNYIGSHESDVNDHFVLYDLLIGSEILNTVF